jgi:5-methylcytosine-specific restriction endonuclease McrA
MKRSGPIERRKPLRAKEPHSGAPRARVQTSRKRITQLRPGDTVPEAPPRRYPRKDGYVRLRWKVAPNTYVETYEHRVFEGVVTRAEHVHHRNLTRGDNRLSNRQPLTAAEHAAEHARHVAPRRALIVKYYEAGATTTQIGRRLRLHPSWVQRQLDEAGIPRRPSGAPNPLDEELALAMYRDGASPVKIARVLHVDTERVKQLARDAGLPPRRSGRPADGINNRVRREVLERDGWTCVRCGVDVSGAYVYSIHHRKLRSQGGPNTPENLITLCGTGTTFCHGYVHAHPEEAYEAGWLVRAWLRPEDVPIVGDPRRR